MNDRFKFRFFNKITNKIVEPTNWQHIDTIFECLKQQISFDNNIPPMPYDHINNGLVFMQCTGLKDKNGKLIYEGDIVNDKSNHIRVCVYEYDMFKYPALKTSRYFHKAIKNKKCNRCEGLLSKLTFQDCLSKKDKNEFEVIGNIYENKEMLDEMAN